MDIRNLTLAVVVAAVCGLSAAAQGVQPAAAPDTAAASLPVSRVVLFSSGLGFFQREGEISGDARVELTVGRSDVNDLLKSLIVNDPSGKVLSVNYTSQDPLSRALKSFPIDLSDDPAIGEILKRARGAMVSVGGTDATSGLVVGLENRRVANGGSVDLFVNLLTATGAIRSVDLTQADSVRFLDPRIQRSIVDALALISANRNADTKQLSVRFSGGGQRKVSLSYLIQTPVWKTSYRLSVAAGKPTFLQGWAIVDNPTDDDWNAVRLDLVSGEPISFRMNLEAPVYAHRPVVPVPLPPSVAPQTYESGTAPRAAEAAPPSAALRSAPAPRAATKSVESYRAPESASGSKAFSLSRGVESVASASEVGQFFQYSIKTPVTLLRHQSAMVPIVNQKIEGTPVAIYDERVLKSHPLSGLEIKNSTGLHLMAGPITVFEDGVYAGDAEVADLPANATRLVSYAVDLKTLVTVSGSSSPEELVSGKIEHGSLIVTRRLERQRHFEFLNNSANPRTILVVYPLSHDWKLVEPAKPKEQTSSDYRFAVTTDPKSGGGASLVIRERRLLSEHVVLANLDSKTILFYLGQREISSRVKGALESINRMKSDLTELTRQRGTIQARINVIYREQERIRSNMKVLQSTSGLYKRYSKTLADQEDQLSAERKRIDQLTAEINQQTKRIDDFVSSLGTLE